MLPAMLTVPSLEMPPLLLEAELPEKVLLVMFAVLPPPSAMSLAVTVLPEKVLLLMVTVPPTKDDTGSPLVRLPPKPLVAELPEKMLLLMLTVPLSLARPPPLPPLFKQGSTLAELP